MSSPATAIEASRTVPTVESALRARVQPSRHHEWREFMDALHAENLPVERSTSREPLGSWRQWRAGWGLGEPIRPVEVCRRGVSVLDLMAVVAVSRQGRGGPNVAGASLALRLDALRDLVPHWPLQDLVGWYLVSGPAVPQATREQRLTEMVQAWQGAGFGSQAYRYVAAGWSLPEVVAMRDAGALPDRGQVEVLIGLRGAWVPAGT